MVTFDYVLVGGGLQNALLAAALVARRPKARVALLEAAPRIGGNHTRRFHSPHLQPPQRAFVEPFVVHASPATTCISRARLARCRNHTPRSARTRCTSGERLATSGRLELRLGIARSASSQATWLATVRPGGAGGDRVHAALTLRRRARDRFQSSSGSSSRSQQAWAHHPHADGRASGRRSTAFAFSTSFRSRRIVCWWKIPISRILGSRRAGTPHRHPRATAKARGVESSRCCARRRACCLCRRMPLRPPIQPGLLHGGYQGGWFHPTTAIRSRSPCALAATIASAPIEALSGASRRSLQRARHSAMPRCSTACCARLFAPEQRYHVA